MLSSSSGPDLHPPRHCPTCHEATFYNVTQCYVVRRYTLRIATSKWGKGNVASGSWKRSQWEMWDPHHTSPRLPLTCWNVSKFLSKHKRRDGGSITKSMSTSEWGTIDICLFIYLELTEVEETVCCLLFGFLMTSSNKFRFLYGYSGVTFGMKLL